MKYAEELLYCGTLFYKIYNFNNCSNIYSSEQLKKHTFPQTDGQMHFTLDFLL